MSTIYRITAQARFPEGVNPGAGSSSNKNIASRNGRNELVLRGSALAGVLRSAFARKSQLSSSSAEVSRWFGSALDGDQDNVSMVKVADSVLSAKHTEDRTHIMINRHTGAVAKGALFSIESAPPECSTLLSVTVSDEYNPESTKDFVQQLIQLIGNGLIIGGNSNRGIGRMVADKIFLKEYNTDTIEGAAAWLDDSYAFRKGELKESGSAQSCTAQVSGTLNIHLELGIPRGQDLLVADGQEADYQLQPQEVIFADGSSRWRIPGSSLRGLFRSWMTRCAARDGFAVRDSHERWAAQFVDKGKEYKPDLAGWGFAGTESGADERDRAAFAKDPALLDDPILDLFGSMYKKGRLHISDSFSKKADNSKVELMTRMHVAVDRFSGGAHEGALFNNQVLCGTNEPVFPVHISIENPQEKEVEWLVRTVRALHYGIIAVGSSKSSGRLEVKAFAAQGPLAEKATFSPKESD